METPNQIVSRRCVDRLSACSSAHRLSRASDLPPPVDIHGSVVFRILSWRTLWVYAGIYRLLVQEQWTN